MDIAHRLAIIESTVPVLEQYGRAIIDRFYERLLDENPSLTHVFNLTHQATGDQPQALADAVTAAARNVRNLSVLVPAVTQIAHKHRSIGVTPEQYAIVGQTLLVAMKDVLGEAATPDIIEAWGQTYQGLAAIFIQSENQLYDEAHNTRGGGDGLDSAPLPLSIKFAKVMKLLRFIFLRRTGGVAKLFTWPICQCTNSHRAVSRSCYPAI